MTASSHKRATGGRELFTKAGGRLFLFALAASLFAATQGEAKTYSAERFDVRVRVQPGGTFEVTETVVFRFEDGTFSNVYRDLRTRRTDGIEIIAASMDGREMPVGDQPGQVEISRKSRVRVRWRFSPVAGSSHTFALTYLVRGVVNRQDGLDVLAWRALPSDHVYPIASSTIQIEHDQPLAGDPLIETRRVANASVDRSEGVVSVTASGVGRNGWVEVEIPFSPGTLIANPPVWQQRQIYARAIAPRWWTAALLVFGAGIILLFGLRQGYDAPRRERFGSHQVQALPDLPAPLAGAIASNGSTKLEHAMAALFALAERGDLSIIEEGRGLLGQRHFVLRRNPTARPLETFETTALAIVFRDDDAKGEVALSKARSRLTRDLKRFAADVKCELASRGLLDEHRRRLRARVGYMSAVLLLVGAATFVAAALLVREFGAWPFLVPAAMVAVGVVGLMTQAGMTPLANEGVRLADRLRGFRAHLTDVAHHNAHAVSDSPSALLAFAVALGLAPAWAKFIKQQPAGAPPWFHALETAASPADGFSALIVAGGAGSSGGGAGGAGGGAAGGGASGAG